jgi:hypothetical protein
MYGKGSIDILRHHHRKHLDAKEAPSIWHRDNIDSVTAPNFWRLRPFQVSRTDLGTIFHQYSVQTEYSPCGFPD